MAAEPQNRRPIMLTSRQPIWIGWGPELIYLYNDPYKSIIGGKHPWALGRPTSTVWHEIWGDIGPMLATAMTGIEGTYVEEQLLIMERNGYPEETYYTFSNSPIPDDDGSAGGIICANTDDTKRVIGERQLSLLRQLAADASEARTWQEAFERSLRALSTNPRDLPFAMLYDMDVEGEKFFLAGSCGIEGTHPAAPSIVDPKRMSPWPLPELSARSSRFSSITWPPNSLMGYPPGPGPSLPTKQCYFRPLQTARPAERQS